MPEPDIRHVFVYGTLRQGCANDIARLVPQCRRIGDAQVQGVLYRVSWYPGLRLGGDDAVPVRGEVYVVDAAGEAVLDELEGIVPDEASSEYAKRSIVVEVGGAPLRCLVYEINPERVRTCEVIAGGDWVDFIQRNPHFAK